MPSFLHILKNDSGDLARPVIATNAASPGARVTVVVLDNAGAADLPAGVRVRRLGEGDLDYPALLDLIFDSDHVITW